MPERCSRCLDGIGVAGRQDHVAALARERLSGRTPQPAARTDDDRHLPGQPEVHARLPLLM
jgi:hypothetical protein